MRHELKGFDKVFSFTFRQHWSGKSFRRATVITAVLCFLLPALILPLVEVLSHREADAPEINSDTFVSAVEQVYVVDETSTAPIDMHVWTGLVEQGNYSDIEYISATADTARVAVENASHALILYLREQDGGYAVQILTPEQTALDEAEITRYTAFINASLPALLAMKMEIATDRANELLAPVEIAEHRGGVMAEPTVDETLAGDVMSQEQTREVLAMILPYFNIMILYFMVLFYGQGVANSVILEKTSKLVDTFLVTVRPTALVMGKLFAIASSGALQLLCWLASLIGGFAVGAVAVKLISPDSQMGLLLLIDQIDLWGGMFSLPTILLSVLMLCVGFLLYCALAAIGGAMASKPEELASTNSLFSMVLIISFLCTLYAGGMGTGMSSSATWLNWIPFTAIFVVPSRMLIGEITLGSAMISFALVALMTFLLVLFAGRVYRMLILYKGRVPKFADVFKMLGNRP